ncbi:ribosomal protein S19 family protein [Candidatus Micrarchaeota archaeon]|nr:ribosomal protein S19 family protein [Candidatus Micrarchaeota archaeon]
MARKDTFKGKTEEELKALTMDQFAELIDSRSRRALKRASKNNPDFIKLIKKVKKIKDKGKDKEKVIRTRLRSAVILPEWIGLTFGVHNGKEYKIVKITTPMVGRRLGDFSYTTYPVKHSGPGVGATRGSKFVPLK